MKLVVASITAAIFAMLVGAWHPYPGPGTPPAPTVPPYPGPATATPKPTLTVTPAQTVTPTPAPTVIPTLTLEPCDGAEDCTPTSIGITDVGAGQVTPLTGVLLFCIGLSGLALRRLWIWIRYE